MAFLELAITAATCLTIVYFYFKNCYRYWKDRNVSFEPPKLFFGNVLDIALGKNNLGKYIANLYKKFDTPYFGIFIFNKPVLVIKDPNILKRIFVKDFQSFTDKNFFADDKIDSLFSKSMITASSKKWKLLRSQLSNIFTTGKIKAMIELEKKIADKLVEDVKLQSSSDINIYDSIGKFVTNSIISCFYGIDSNFFDTKNPIKHHGFQLFPQGRNGLIKIYSYNFLHTIVRLFRFNFFNKESSKFLYNLFSCVIKERVSHNSKRLDLVSLLIKLMDQKVLEEDALISQAITFYVAGLDTTTIITSFAIYELSKNVEIQNRLREEITQHDCISYESINNMKYLHAIVSETLRKYPVVNFLQRKCTADYVIPESGLKIERNTNVMIPVHGLHFDESYFPNSHKFDPERFDATKNKKINSYVYMPFGVGPRSCIGSRFALLTVKMALVNLLKNFKFKEYTHQPNLVFNTSHIGHSQNDPRAFCELIPQTQNGSR